jgi:hypothetical protein
MADNAGARGLDNETYAFMKNLIGMKAACTVLDLASKEAELRYASFAPVGDMLIGVRVRNLTQAGDRPRGRSLKIIDGKIQDEPRANVTFTPAFVPHHPEYNYGFWHINDGQEMALNFRLSEKKAVTVLVEGFANRGRRDRFAWFCLNCVNPLYMREVETGRLGLPGFYGVEDDAINTFNGDKKLRTCRECGTVHPLAYSIFEWNDTPELRQARMSW